MSWEQHTVQLGEGLIDVELACAEGIELTTRADAALQVQIVLRMAQGALRQLGWVNHTIQDWRYAGEGLADP